MNHSNDGVLTILGIDPGLANMGVAVLQLTRVTEILIRVEHIETVSSDKKRKILVADDNTRRATELFSKLEEIFQVAKPNIVCAETMSHPRNSSAAAKLAMSWGILIALAAQRKLPILQASPQEIKLALCKKRDASKEDIQAAVLGKYSSISEFLRGVPKTKLEHPYDAVAAAITCMSSETVRSVRSMLPR